MKIRGQVINNEFDLLCVGYEIEGALKARLAKIYKDSGMGGVIAELRNLGDENTLNEEFKHTKKLIGERETLAKLLPDPEKRQRRKHQARVMTSRLLGFGKEREGD